MRDWLRVHWIKKKLDFKTYLEKLEILSIGEKIPKNMVPATLYACMDHNKMIGAVHIRHRLNDKLRHIGGHIGYGVRPSERGKGVGKEMLALALEKVKKLGIQNVLVTCDKSNLSSAGVIKANGGKLESEAVEKEEVIQCYIIKV